MDFKRFAVSKSAELDQVWAECGALFRADAERIIRLWTTLSEGDMQQVRGMADQDLQIVTTLAMLALNHLTQQAAEEIADRSEQ